ASVAFTITPAAADHLAIIPQPTGTAAAAAGITARTVQPLDHTNNLTTTRTNVTLAVGTKPGGGTLSGTTTVPASRGVASFSTLSIDKTGTGYALVASSGSLTGATSALFNITPAAANHLAVTAPASATAGTAFGITVRALDPFNNT